VLKFLSVKSGGRRLSSHRPAANATDCNGLMYVVRVRRTWLMTTSQSLSTWTKRIIDVRLLRPHPSCPHRHSIKESTTFPPQVHPRHSASSPPGPGAPGPRQYQARAALQAWIYWPCRRRSLWPPLRRCASAFYRLHHHYQRPASKTIRRIIYSVFSSYIMVAHK